MKRLSAFLIAFLIAVSPAWAEKVRYVIDGDTFILQNNQRVRMVGINAPEISHRRYGKKKGQPYGREAKACLADLIDKKEVRLTRGGKDEFDRYGRRLAFVYLPDGTFVNREMVARGCAETYRKFSFDEKDDFLKAEDQARLARKGMWAEKKSGWLQSAMEILNS